MVTKLVIQRPPSTCQSQIAKRAISNAPSQLAAGSFLFVDPASGATIAGRGKPNGAVYQTSSVTSAAFSTHGSFVRVTGELDLALAPTWNTQ
jgi:hypothetical protein